MIWFLSLVQYHSSSQERFMVDLDKVDPLWRVYYRSVVLLFRSCLFVWEVLDVSDFFLGFMLRRGNASDDLMISLTDWMHSQVCNVLMQHYLTIKITWSLSICRPLFLFITFKFRFYLFHTLVLYVICPYDGMTHYMEKSIVIFMFSSNSNLNEK